jgi:hypothetical protein
VLVQLGFPVDVTTALAVELMEEDFAAMRTLKTVCRVLPTHGLMCRTSARPIFYPLVAPPLGEEVLSAMIARVSVIWVLLAALSMLIT